MIQQHLPIEGTHNLRDLGGYPTQDGGQTRRGVYLRADNLDQVTAAGQAELYAYGLRHVIDLRTTDETQRWPDVFAGSTVVQYHHLPFFDTDPSMDDINRLDEVIEIYQFMIERCQPAVRTILETIGAADEGAVLVHCAGGKDRTGIISALLLGLAGVDDDTIVADYALTTDLTGALRPVWRAEAEAAGRDLVRHDRMVIAAPAYMRGTLDYLRTRYGGIVDYVRAVGVEDATIEMLRHRLVAV